ncbi:MAG TPA: hypothetical protein GXX28_04990 [Firmicutes bacterium]|nr:hypothetical protein [Bacillota bacterium]
MKKLSIALAVALAFAVAAPAVAAPSVAISGSLETKFTAQPGSALQNESFLSLQAGLQGGSDKTKAVVILAPWAKPDSVYSQHPDPADPSKTTEFTIASNASSIVDDRSAIPGAANPTGASFGEVFTADFSNMIRSMYLQTTGSFWNGGPEATTTIGSIAVNESPFVGDLGNRRGVKVEGLKIGPLGIEAFYATPSGFARTLNYDADYQNPQTRVKNTDTVEGVKLNANLAGISMMANVVKSDDNAPEMAFTGAMSPIQNLGISGMVIRDRNQNQAAQIGASYAVMPNLTVSASYRDADKEIAPLYPTRYDADGNGILTTDEWIDSVNNRKFQAFDNKTGVKVGADTILAGVHVSGSYDMAKAVETDQPVATVAADTQLAGFKLNSSVKFVGKDLNDLTWGAGRDFQVAGMDINGSYAGERDSQAVISHELKASTTLNLIPQLQGLTLDGRYKTYSDGTHYEAEAGANYQAPNGMTFGVRHLIDKDHQNGETTFTSGLKVQF